MDQLKELLAKLGKHGFWIACGLVTVVSLAVWWMATGALVEEYEREASNLDSAVSAISNIQSQMPTHPNDASHQVMENLIAEQREEVLEAWRMQYRDQQEILVWPERLGPAFIREFSPLIPIELNFQEFPVPSNMEKETTLRERYRDYIKDVMEPLAKKAGAEWKADFNASRGTMGGGPGMGGGGEYGAEMGGGPGMEMGAFGPGGGGRGLPQKKPPLVAWSTQSQEALLSDLFPWRGNIPSTLEVLYSQENLWVLDQLLQIIADTNGDVSQRFQAKIREIEEIGIGRSATRAAGVISPVGGARRGRGMEGDAGMEMDMGMGGGPGMDADMNMDAGMGMGAGMMDGGGPGSGRATVPDPADGRYVDGEYQPIDAQRVRSAMVSNSPEDASLAVAKRIPVKLRLKMDQRSIPKLLAICGNASLMVEVRQLRIDPSASGSRRGGGGGGMEGAGYGAEMGEDGGEMAAAPGGGGRGRDTAPQFPMDITVEIFGIIYLFNPPAAERLGIEQVNEDTVIDGKSMAEEAVDEGVRAAPVDGIVNPPSDADDSADPSAQPADPTAAEADVDAANGAGPSAGEPQTSPDRPEAAAPAPSNPGQPPGDDSAAPTNP